MGAIEGKKLEELMCPFCVSFSSKRHTAFSKHLEDVHGVSVQDAWDSLHGGRPTCKCGCGGAVKWNGWGKGYSSVICGHNGSIYTACSSEEAQKIAEKRAMSLRGKSSWAKGLTKENDERIAARGRATSVGRREKFRMGEISIWSKGLTKESDERVSKLSQTLKEKFAIGDVRPWAKGLTKETDDRLIEMGRAVSLSLQQRSIREKLDGLKRLSHEEVKRRIEESGDLELLDGLDSYINDMSKVIVVRCKKCGDSFQGSLRVLSKGRCFKCSPGGSTAQEELARFIESLGIEIRRNDRKMLPLELDIFIPKKNMAIEYNGLYWHSHYNKSPHYHENKTKMAREAGVNLIHIFEDEWRDKRQIAESIIRAKLGLCQTKIGARSCKIVEMTSAQRREFFEKNHLDGDVKSEIAWGLKLNDGFVYGISLRRPFHKKYKHGLEVARCCPALNMIVPGGLSKLMECVKNYCHSSGVKSIITYVDTRLGGDGRGYEIAGFVRTGETVPRWWWTDLNERFNRFKFKADSERKMTEAEIAIEAGVVKIWGCENIIYQIEI